MNINIFSLLIRGSFGALWGLCAVVGAYMLGAWLPEIEFVFYPLIFAGAVPAAVLYTGKNVPLLRAVFLGALSGLIYALISPLFPLIAAILAGASLGGGLGQNSEGPGSLLGLILNTLKGAVILPLVIVVGSMISGSLSIITAAPLYHWLFWGFWSVVGVMFIKGRAKNLSDKEFKPLNMSALDDFRSDAKEIKTELSELSVKLDR